MHACRPGFCNSLARLIIARVQKDGADQSFAYIAQNGSLFAATRLRFAVTQFQMRPNAPFDGNFRAAFLTHEICETA